jgi:predicted ATPase/class 3 adenylate cyclase
MPQKSLAPFIAIDRRFALAQGASLPEGAVGAALFADVSGFTPLSNALARDLGPQRGAEELSRQLNLIYTALIAEVDRYHGAVIAFAGDAITCWFEEADQEAEAVSTPEVAADRAAACALAMQALMATFAELRTPGGGVVNLAIKVVISYGPVRRYMVGDPTIQLMDALAGATISRLALADRVARRGEVLASAEAVVALSAPPRIGEWRPDEQGAPGFATILALAKPVPADPWPPLALDTVPIERLRQWLLPPIYARLVGGQGQFLAELRPAVALFVQFEGIDYDGDPEARTKLDTYICWSQSIVARYGGALLQLTIGDKGSSFYCSFGAPLAHENDPARAAQAALLLRAPPPALGFVAPPRIGISQGRMRTGAYGGETRLTYGALGEDVNMAARLMQAAPAGQIYVSAATQAAAGGAFLWEQLPPLSVKGRSEPLTAYRLVAARERTATFTQAVRYGLPLVGRSAELGRITTLIDKALAGRGQLIAITAEAGLGKSRLVVEAMRLAGDRGMAIYAGEAQSYGTNDSYLAWESIWQAFFGLDRALPHAEQLAALEAAILAIDPELLPRLPLLGPAVNLSIADSDLTRSLDSRLRKISLESLLVACLRARAAERPLLLVIEDAHWLDPLSHELLEQLGRVIVDLPVLIVAAMRPPELDHLIPPRILALEHCTQIILGELTPGEAADLITLKQIHLDMPTPLSDEVVARLVVQSQGNPFFIEELLNYLHSRGLAPQTAQELEQLELPTSLASLILSRIDQLSEAQKATLKVAAVIGRLFRAAWLWGVLPALGQPPQVRADLETLSQLELTLLDQPEPDLVFLFKHILTHGVAYESLPFETRSWLHGEVGLFIERTYFDLIDQYVDVLAYHFDLSQHEERQRLYLQRAAEAAQAAYANSAAVDYYTRLLAVLPPAEQGPARLRLAQVQELIGAWAEAAANYRQARELAEARGDQGAMVECERAIGWLYRKQAEHGEAKRWLERARQGYLRLGDVAGAIQTLADLGEVHRLQGDYTQAGLCFAESQDLAETATRTPELLAARANALKGAGTLAAQQGSLAEARNLYEQSLTIRHELGDRPGEAAMLNNLGMVAMHRAEHTAAGRLFREALALMRQIGDRWAMGVALNNLGLIERYLDHADQARQILEESLAVRRALGDKWGVANALSSLANLLLHCGNHAELPALLRESIELNLGVGDRVALAYCLEDYAGLAAARGSAERALELAGAAAALRTEVGAPLPPGEQEALERLLAGARAALGAGAEATHAAGAALSLAQAVELAKTWFQPA